MRLSMGCFCNSSNYEDRELNCKKCNPYCDQCYPISSPITEYFSDKYHNLEYNYPVNRCKCNPFGISPKYYSQIYKPCNCKDKCYPC